MRSADELHVPPLVTGLPRVLTARVRDGGLRGPRLRRRFRPYARGFYPWLRAARSWDLPATSNGPVTAVLLSYRRPHNLELAVRTMLATPAVGHVVVSNNNPDVDIERVVRIRHPRLAFRFDPDMNATRRYIVAREASGDHFFLPDDDLFFRPRALDDALRAFVADPIVPRGVMGQRLLPDRRWQRMIIAPPAQEVDVLNRAYLCSRAHAEEVHRLGEALGFLEGDGRAFVEEPADDVLLSFGGPRRPLVIDLPFVDCVTGNAPGIATFRKPGFNEKRRDWVLRLREIKPMEGMPWDLAYLATDGGGR